MPGKHAINMFETGLDREPANYVALTPLNFLDWVTCPHSLYQLQCLSWHGFLEGLSRRISRLI